MSQAITDRLWLMEWSLFTKHCIKLMLGNSLISFIVFFINETILFYFFILDPLNVGAELWPLHPDTFWTLSIILSSCMLKNVLVWKKSNFTWTLVWTKLLRPWDKLKKCKNLWLSKARNYRWDWEWLVFKVKSQIFSTKYLLRIRQVKFYFPFPSMKKLLLKDSLTYFDSKYQLMLFNLFI